MFYIFVGTLLVKLLLELKRFMLIKSNVFCPRVLGLCGLLSMNEDDFIDVDTCMTYTAIYPSMPSKIILNHIFLMYYVTMDLYSVVLF